MREFKFRAKTVRNNEWVYGHYAFVDGHHIIYENGKPLNIKMNTLSEYTGLKDINDKEIYEGDILTIKNEISNWKGYIIFEEGNFKILIINSWGISKKILNEKEKFSDMGASFELSDTYNVIGNIYENPELLEE